MKKQILLVQSLLLLPLVSTSSLLGMEYESTTVASSTAEHSDLSGSIPSLFEEGTTPLSLSITSETNAINGELALVEAEIAALDHDKVRKALHAELPFNIIIFNNVKEKKAAHQEKLKAFHAQLLSNNLILNSVKPKQEITELDSTADINKTVEVPLEAWKNTNKIFPIEEWEQYDVQTLDKLYDQTTEINGTFQTVVLKEQPLADISSEQKLFNKVVRQLNLRHKFINVALLKQPTMHPTHQEMLTKSIMITQTPQQTGLDSLPYTLQAGYKLGTHKAHHIIEYLFTDTGKKPAKKTYKYSVKSIDDVETGNSHTAEYQFDVTNKTHVQLLEDTLNYYMDNNNTQALMTLLDKCQCSAGELQINPRVAGDIDKYFDSIIKDKETETQFLLKKQHDEFTQKTNALIIALQEEFAQRVEALDKAYDKYAQETNDAFIKNADQIRQFNENTLAAYNLSPHYAFGKTKPQLYVTPEVSKTNPQAHLTRGKVHMTQQDVKDVYNNHILLEKVEMHKSMTAANNECFDLLEHLGAIKLATQGVKLLTNYSTTTK
jgi:hypothetical protein